VSSKPIFPIFRTHLSHLLHKPIFPIYPDKRWVLERWVDRKKPIFPIFPEPIFPILPIFERWVADPRSSYINFLLVSVHYSFHFKYTTKSVSLLISSSSLFAFKKGLYSFYSQVYFASLSSLKVVGRFCDQFWSRSPKFWSREIWSRNRPTTIVIGK